MDFSSNAEDLVEVDCEIEGVEVGASFTGKKSICSGDSPDVLAPNNHHLLLWRI